MNWVFDVDGTVIGSIRSDRIRPGAECLFAALVDRGHGVVLWSAGGAEYVRRKAQEHGLDRWTLAYYGKDERDAAGRYSTAHVARAHRPDVFVDDSPGDLPDGTVVLAVSQFLGNNAADAGLLTILADLDAIIAGITSARVGA
jgi:long-chain acyl-CoA synthetase